MARKYAWIFIVFVPESEQVSESVQIMSKYKYPSIVSPQMEAIVFIILQIFFATRAALKIGEYSRIFSSYSPVLAGEYLMDYIWWIIILDISCWIQGVNLLRTVGIGGQQMIKVIFNKYAVIVRIVNLFLI